MKFGILSYRTVDRKAQPEEIRIKNELRSMGHQARIFRSQRFQLVYNQESPWLLYDGKPMPKQDVFITRPGMLSNVSLKAALIEQIEMMGIPLFNRYEPIVKTKNKVKTMQVLDHYGIPIPKTVIIQRPEDIAQAAKLVGGFPLILKSAYGSFGIGVTIVESMRALKSILTWSEDTYMLQQYVKYSQGKDLRVFVVNGRVVGAMMRAAKKGEFRSNIELGGKGTPVEISDEEASVALRCVQAMDLNYGGVDIIRTKDGPLVLEVNANPGFKALEAATELNVAGAIAEYAIEFGERHRGRE